MTWRRYPVATQGSTTSCGTADTIKERVKLLGWSEDMDIQKLHEIEG
jgi:hypothetical protein